MSRINYPEKVIKLIDIFSRHNHEAIAVGGCVRDSLMGKIPQAKTPCVFYEFMWSGRIDGGKVSPTYSVYFPVNCGTSKPNPTAAHKAIMESANHAFKFITWLRNEQDNGRRELQQLDLENASIEPYGPLLNGWYTMFVQLSDVDTFSICVDEDDYIDAGNSYE